MKRASRKVKAQALHRVYTLIKFLDPEAEIKRCSLHSIYEVNKYSIRVKFNQKKVKILLNKFLEKYCDEYGLEKTKDTIACYENKELGIFLFISEQDMKHFGSDEILIDMSIH